MSSQSAAVEAPSPPAGRRAVIVGGGPAGLMAAEVLSAGGWSVDLYERMPTVGRKLLMAGRGGLNLTHSEPMESFVGRYGAASERLRPLLAAFSPVDLRAWAQGLGQPTFSGSSGRVFPKSMKASPLLRAWLVRLGAQGVIIHTRHDWTGWTAAGRLRFAGPAGEVEAPAADATVLALGGASWPSLGSNGAWSGILAARGVPVLPFKPANCGFVVAWSELFASRFAGQPLKNIAVGFDGRQVRGEAMIVGYGLEGGAIYAMSGAIRDRIAAAGSARITIDLRPDVPVNGLALRLGRRRAGETLSSVLRRQAGLEPQAANLLRESYGGPLPADPAALATAIKSAPITLTAPQSLARAISSAGGVGLAGVTANLELQQMPGVHVVGEMLDWEAPTGGYLLQAAFAMGVAAARSILASTPANC